MIRTTLTAALALIGAATAPAMGETSLTVTLNGLDPQSGTVNLALFAGEAAWSANDATTGARITVDAETATATLSGIEPGTYGIKLYHDTNGNGEMDTNPFGIPTEPYAFSNDARGRFGPPSFEAAAFEVFAGENSHAIRFD